MISLSLKLRFALDIARGMTYVADKGRHSEYIVSEFLEFDFRNHPS